MQIKIKRGLIDGDDDALVSTESRRVDVMLHTGEMFSIVERYEGLTITARNHNIIVLPVDHNEVRVREVNARAD